MFFFYFLKTYALSKTGRYSRACYGATLWSENREFKPRQRASYCVSPDITLQTGDLWKGNHMWCHLAYTTLQWDEGILILRRWCPDLESWAASPNNHFKVVTSWTDWEEETENCPLAPRLSRTDVARAPDSPWKRRLSVPAQHKLRSRGRTINLFFSNCFCAHVNFGDAVYYGEVFLRVVILLPHWLSNVCYGFLPFLSLRPCPWILEFWMLLIFGSTLI